MSRPEQEVNRYNAKSIARSEQMYGEGWQSPGGLEMVKFFASHLRLHKGMRLLDIGSGLGGALFYFAKENEMTCVGIDIASAMVEESTKRAKIKGVSEKVSFVEGDFLRVSFKDESFDVVWSRDAILYNKNKLKVFEKAFSLLKSGGQLFITDFIRGKEVGKDSFESYLVDCEYYLQTLDNYAKTIADAGFVDIKAVDVTPEFIQSLKDDKERLISRKLEFLKEFTQEDYDYLIDRWDGKIEMCENNDLGWGMFTARKV